MKTTLLDRPSKKAIDPRFWVGAVVGSVFVGQKVRVFDTDFCRKEPEDLRKNYREGVITKIVDATSTGWAKHVHFKVFGSPISDELTFFTLRGNRVTHYVFVLNSRQMCLF